MGRILRVGAVALALAVGGFFGWFYLIFPYLQDRAREAYLREQAPPQPLSFEELGSFDPVLRETSGLAVSRRHPGVLWTHNDSGDGPRIYAVDLTARLLGTFEVTGASAQDWEAMDLGPCPDDAGRDCLYVGDIGDNGLRRDELTVYVLPEPDPAQRGATLPAARLRYAYPDTPHDAEALAVAPDGELVIVTKGRTPEILLFSLPAARVREAVARDAPVALPPGRVLPIRPDWTLGRTVTGAGFSPDGSTLAVRTYTEVFFLPWPWSGRESGPLPSCFLHDRNLGGESLAYGSPRDLLLTEESGSGRPATLSRVRCAGGGDAASDSIP